MATVGAVAMQVRADMRSGRRSWAWFAIVTGLVGAVVLIGATGARRAETAYPRFLASTAAADVLAAPQQTGMGGFDAALTRLPGVTSAGVVSGMDLFTRSAPHVDVVALSGMDGHYAHTIERPKITEGRMSDPDKADEAVAVRGAAQALHLHAGDTLQLVAAPDTAAGPDLAHAKPVTMKIVGIGVTRDDVVPANTVTQPILLTTAAFRRQFDSSFNSFDGAYLRLAPGTTTGDINRRAQALAAKDPETGGSALVADEHAQASTVERAIRPQAGAVALFALILAIVGLFVIGQLAIRRVASATTDRAVLREVGMTRGQLVAVGLSEVAAGALVGAVIAVVVAVVTSPLMPLGAARVAEPRPGFAVNWSMLAIGAAGIVVLVVAWTALPIWRMASRLADAQLSFTRPSRVAGAVARWGWPAASVGARLSVQSGRGRGSVPLRSAIAGTVVAVGALAAALTFGINLVQLVQTPRLYGQTWAVGVDTGFGNMPANSIAGSMRTRPGVTGWTNGNHATLTIDGHDIPAIGLAEGRGPISWPTIVEGRAPRGSDELVLGSKTLSSIHASVGDTVKVRDDDGTRSMRVVGRAVFPLFGQGSFTSTGLGVGAAMLNSAPADEGFNFFLVSTKPGAPISGPQLSGELQRTNVCPPDQSCDVFTAQRPFDVDDYARVRSTPALLAGLLAFLALATMAHLSLTTTRRRRHDLAVLRTLGFVRRQVAEAVSWQASALVLISLAIGLPIGVAVGRWLWTWFADQIGAVVSLSAPVGWLLLAVPIALVAVNVIAVGPAWVAARRALGPALRSE
jgi:ABC-type lipoprotein release transport system permease subunit